MRSRAWGAMVLAVGGAACGSLGERANEQACPTSEICSPATPYGLAFLGPPLADLGNIDESVLPVAVGGTETIEVDLRDVYGAETPFTTPHTAQVTSALTATDVVGANVTLVGTQPGDGILRITDPTSGALFDELPVSAMAIATVSLRPLDVGTSIFGIDVGDAPLALWPGATADVVVALQAADGTRLVDESMTITGAASRTWDSASLGVQGGEPTTVTVTPSSGAPVAFTVPPAGPLDRIATYPPVTGSAQFLTLCLAAYSGDTLVLGAPWHFSATAPASPASPDGNGESVPCVEIDYPTGTRAVTVTATAGAYTQTFNLTVPAETRPISPRPARGERLGVIARALGAED